MIISEQYGFAFVHIPKCAGTTVREQLKDLDETQGAFSAVSEHPALGRIDYMHLPLRVLSEHFPDTLSTLKRLDVYAVTRDPSSRFRSSVSEYLKRVKHSRLAEVSTTELEKVIDEIIDRLEKRPAVPSYDIAHFTPQCDYIWLDGCRVVQHTVALENIRDLFIEIAHRTGQPIDENAWSNQDFVLRFEGLKRSISNVNELAREILPYRTYQTLKRVTRPFLVKERALPASDAVLRSDRVSRFVQDYYARDVAQHTADLCKSAPAAPTAQAV